MMMRTTDDDEDETHFISTPFWDSSPSAKFGYTSTKGLCHKAKQKLGKHMYALTRIPIYSTDLSQYLKELIP